MFAPLPPVSGMDHLVNFLSSIRPQKDSDLVDKFSYYYTVIVLCIFSIFNFGWSFVGSPIQCWFPAYYKGWWIEYALDYCYVQNTYFLPFITKGPFKNYWSLGLTTDGPQMVDIPSNITHREDRLLGYYQWVPFVLALEALCFYLPVLIWRNLYEASGVKVKAILETLGNTENMSAAARRDNIDKISMFMDRSIDFTKRAHGHESYMAGRYITNLYLAIKIIFAINCIAQFFLLTQFLGLDNIFWGATVLKNLVSGVEWPETGHFPRVTMCDFEVRVLGNIHRHTVQCVLMINMFNEKIFVFLWWWFLIVAVISVLSMLYWLLTSISDSAGERIINSYIERIDQKGDYNDKRNRQMMIKKFLRKCLKADGIFILRLAASNCGDVVTSDLIESMWQKFKKREDTELNNGKPDPPSRTLRGTAPPYYAPTETPM